MEAPGIICLFLCVSIDTVKRAEKFGRQMLALLLFSRTATSVVVYVHILRVVSCWQHISHISTFHKLQHRFNLPSHKYLNSSCALL
jgi:hypothetical protein